MSRLNHRLKLTRCGSRSGSASMTRTVDAAACNARGGSASDDTHAPRARG